MTKLTEVLENKVIVLLEEIKKEVERLHAQPLKVQKMFRRDTKNNVSDKVTNFYKENEFTPEEKDIIQEMLLNYTSNL